MPRRASKAWLCTAALLAGLTLGGAAAAWERPGEREKTDVVILDNGDRVTGRILNVQYGKLQISSRHSGTVSIEWPAIRSLQSTYAFRVERFGGAVVAGHISTREDGRTLVIESGREGETSIPMAEVSRITPYDDDFWHRIDGSVSLGYNYTRSTEVSQASASFDAHYAGDHVDSQASGHVIINHDNAQGTTDQNQLIGSTFFLTDSRNFWGLLGEYERNQSLGINSRLLGGPLLGRRVYQSGIMDLTAVAGVVYDHEWVTGDEGSRGSTEGLIQAEWRVYKFIYPKVALDMTAMAFPSISDAPRFRAGLNVSLTFKMTDRFALTLSEYGNYDSRPPGESTENLDYGVTASLTYNFGYVIP